jgi:hypothetical protein
MTKRCPVALVNMDLDIVRKTTILAKTAFINISMPAWPLKDYYKFIKKPR